MKSTTTETIGFVAYLCLILVAILIGLLSLFADLSCHKHAMERIAGHKISWWNAYLTD
jgi:hypothetical protein